MAEVRVRKEDQILMSLVHFFVTEANYAPVFVHGVKDEIWLENIDGPYRIIRINSNLIFNKEQFDYDQTKIKDILKQVKKKTFSFRINALNINLNSNDSLDLDGLKNVDNIKITSFDEIKNNDVLTTVFPKIKDHIYDEKIGLDLIFNVTRDINAKTESDNKRYEKIFLPKKPIITYALISINVFIYFLSLVFPNLYLYLCNQVDVVRMGEYYRLFSYMFMHDTSLLFVHLFTNMYSLFVIGKEIESKFGHLKFIIIYIISGIAGGLLSCAFSSYPSIGASGAIFGLLGAFVYFAYRFRLVFKDALQNQIIPIIALNLILGFIVSEIDNACHIGGLIAGFLTAMALGIPNDKKLSDETNGKILLIIFLLFLVYLVFFR